jgi:hypothetical protein
LARSFGGVPSVPVAGHQRFRFHQQLTDVAVWQGQAVSADHLELVPKHFPAAGLQDGVAFVQAIPVVGFVEDAD